MADSSPFILDISTCLQDDVPEQFRKVGDNPIRVGAGMIGIAEGEEVVVNGIIMNLDSSVMVDATMTAKAIGECVRCLTPLNPELNFHISAVFSNNEDFITDNDTKEEDIEGEVGQIIDNTVDITQTVIDEAGLNLPFNPTCLDFDSSCAKSNSGVPEPDGISSGEERIDPRWASLVEKSGSLGDDK